MFHGASIFTNEIVQNDENKEHESKVEFWWAALRTKNSILSESKNECAHYNFSNIKSRD